MLVGGVLEWVLGNSFPSVVFCTFGGFWFCYGATLIPSFAAFAPYAPLDAGFNASLGETANTTNKDRRHPFG